jgi:hypothetical protein
MSEWVEQIGKTIGNEHKKHMLAPTSLPASKICCGRTHYVHGTLQPILQYIQTGQGNMLHVLLGEESNRNTVASQKLK